MEHTNLAIVIVTYNSEDVISGLLSDLFRINQNGPVIVIDNASSDRTVSIIRSHYPQVVVLQNSQNVGYGKAVNQGVEICHTRYILILNPDIRIPASMVIHEMVDFLDSMPSAAAAGPLQYIKDKNGTRLNFISSYWGWNAFAGYLNYCFQHHWPSQTPIKVPFLNAGCFLVRRSAFNQAGKLNPKHFLYGEEADLGLKFIRYGYDSWLLPQIYVIHFREKSLQGLTSGQRRRIRLQAIVNILDALWSGWYGIIYDKLSLLFNNIRMSQFTNRLRRRE
jgi:hypothetical protein